MKKLHILKIGGNVIDDTDELESFLESFAQLPDAKILIHGGGKLASSVSMSMGIVPQMIDGRRITDVDTLRVVTMVYAGLINKNIVAHLQALNCNAIGLTGADGNIIPAKKRPVRGDIDYGYVGDVDLEKLSGTTLSKLINAGFTPVIAPLTHDMQGNLLNTNADTIASSIAVALSSYYDVSLIYCFEKDGVLKNVEDDNSVIESISSADYGKLREEGIITKGMIPKLDNAFAALRMGVRSVHIAHAKAIKNIKNNNDLHKGTRLYE
jgi:acetylglutamate kinase